MKRNFFKKNRVLLVTAFVILVVLVEAFVMIRRFVVNADEQAKGFPPSCSQNCPNINVTCGASGAVEAGSCSIAVDAVTCARQGLQTGTYSYDKFTSLNQCQRFSGGDTLNDMQSCCALRGSLYKACTPPSDNSPQPKCDDVNVGNAEQQCIKDSMDYYCNSNNPKVDINECKASCQDLVMLRAPEKIFGACMCNLGVDQVNTGTDSKSCCACAKECKSMNRIADDIYPAYCSVGYYQIEPQMKLDLDKVCDSIATSKCDSYNETSKVRQNGKLVSGECSGGTGFTVGQCRSESLAMPDLASAPELSTLKESGPDMICKNFYGAEYTSKITKITTRLCISEELARWKGLITSGQHCTTDFERAGCNEGLCSDRGGGVDFQCVKKSCDLSLPTTMLNPSATSGSGGVGLIKAQKAYAAESLSGVKIKVQKQQGPYAIAGENIIEEIGETSGKGQLYFSLLEGAWNIYAEKAGYQTTKQTVIVSSGMNPTINIVMPPIGASQSITPVASATKTPTAIPTKTATITSTKTSTPISSPTKTPTATPTPVAVVSPNINQFQFTKGFNVIGTNGSILTQLLGQNNMTTFGFNPLINNWDRYNPGVPVTMNQNQAYYAYSNSAKSLTLPSVNPTDVKILKPGWNFLWNESATTKPNLKFTLYNKQGTCLAKDVSINTLEDNGVSYRYVFVVTNPSSQDACQVFSLLTGTDQPATNCTSQNPVLAQISQLPSKKGYWIYVFENKLQNIGIFNGSPCQ